VEGKLFPYSRLRLNHDAQETEPSTGPVPGAYALLKSGTPVSVPAEAVLCQEGRPIANCYFLTQGQIGLEKVIHGKPRQLGLLGPGAMVALMAALDGAPASVTAKALLDSTVIEIAPQGLQGLLASAEKEALSASTLLAVHGIRCLRDATQKLATVLTQSLTQATRPGQLDLLSAARIQANTQGWQLDPDTPTE
jgi:CRP-like cAMP-binding protein